MKKVLWAFALAAAACATPPEPAIREAEGFSESERAKAAFVELQQKLSSRLRAAMPAGPVAAISECRTAAPEIASALASDEEMRLGRTSHKLRNPDNAPEDWILPYLEAAAGKPAAQVPERSVDLGDRIGVLKPIGVQGMCLRCHGSRESLDPELAGALDRLYPEDRAVGFTDGEFRGFFWAEVPKS